MKTTPTPETLSMFDGFKQNLFYAIIAAVAALGVIWLHDALVLGVYLPSKWAFVSGGGMFSVVLGATAVSSSKVAPFALLLLVLVIAFFAYPGSDSTSEPAQDLLKNSQHHNLPVEESVTPPATLEPLLVQPEPEVTFVQPPEASDAVELPSPDVAADVPESE